MLLAILAVLSALFLALLWTPIDLDLAAERDPELALRVRVSWLFGLVTKEFRGDERGSESESKAGVAPSPKPARDRPGGASKFVRVARSKGFAPAVVRFLRRVIRGIELRRAELWARAGFDDPADTGRMLGILYPLTHWLGSALPCRIDVEPDFRGEVLRFHAEGVLRIVPSRVFGPAVALLLSPASVRALLAARA